MKSFEFLESRMGMYIHIMKRRDGVGILERNGCPYTLIITTDGYCIINIIGRGRFFLPAIPLSEHPKTPRNSRYEVQYSEVYVRVLRIEKKIPPASRVNNPRINPRCPGFYLHLP